MEYEGLLKVLKNRRSTRKFKPDPIPDEYIDKIIEAARWAPSGFNSQPWEFVVVKKQELKDQIVQFCNEYLTDRVRFEATREPWLKTIERPLTKKALGYGNAPVFILLFGDTRTRVGLPMELRYDRERGHIVFFSSLANAFLYMNLAATTLGLATQWVSAVQRPIVHCMIKDLLGIPSSMEVYDMLVLGYPAVKLKSKLMRSKEKMVHYDDCGPEDFRTDEEVNDFVRRTRTWVMATMDRKPD